MTVTHIDGETPISFKKEHVDTIVDYGNYRCIFLKKDADGLVRNIPCKESYDELVVAYKNA